MNKTKMTIGTDIIPFIRKDNTDRNRTSPFAFTGNKFEFRMLGSSASISDTNVMINTIVADALCEFADKLETSSDVNADARALIKDTVQKHRRIIFNGDGYSNEWKQEAKKRGLLCLENTAQALPLLTRKENIELFVRHGVFSETEVKCREEIRLENYCKTIHIEALTLLGMIKRDIIPAISNYTDTLCECICKKQKAGSNINCYVEEELVRRLSDENAQLFKLADSLLEKTESLNRSKANHETAVFYHDIILSLMEQIRDIADKAETEVGRKYWPYPTYDQLLFKI